MKFIFKPISSRKLKLGICYPSYPHFVTSSARMLDRTLRGTSWVPDEDLMDKVYALHSNRDTRPIQYLIDRVRIESIEAHNFYFDRDILEMLFENMRIPRTWMS